jgi:phosphomethylpyrimidine synthase
MCGPKFCSMKITEEVRQIAAAQGQNAAEVEAGLAAKAAEFRDGGQRIYAGGDDHH